MKRLLGGIFCTIAMGVLSFPGNSLAQSRAYNGIPGTLMKEDPTEHGHVSSGVVRRTYPYAGDDAYHIDMRYYDERYVVVLLLGLQPQVHYSEFIYMDCQDGQGFRSYKETEFTPVTIQNVQIGNEEPFMSTELWEMQCENAGAAPSLAW
jgi:hypothetical protein